ncbi:hypothetical protein [Pseudomonas sp. NPDC087615]|uniref:hypothetical protein n=1 Tax=Pseudomonas sp. NPDC087615 TaxID=3364443 RepID=UPI00380BFA3C
MTFQLPYPFGVEYMRQNKIFMLFCPPDRLDAEQRPVLEGRSILYTLDECALQPCPYTDSRGDSGKPINVESLKALSRHQEATAQFIQHIGSYLAEGQGGIAGAPDLGRLYALSYIGYRAPSLYFCKKFLDDSVAIPVVCAVASRFFHGLVNMLALIALEHEGRLVGVSMTAEQLYRYADDRGHLIGLKEACAASKATIVKYLALCLEAGATKSPADQPASLPIDAIARTARVTMDLEFASLVYETVRCWFWSRLPGNEDKAVKQMFATTHCLQARKIAKAEQPFEHVLFTRARNLMLTLGREPAAIARLVEIARDGINAVAHDRLSRTVVHERLKAQMVDIFAQQAECLEKHTGWEGCLSSDLDVFFGGWPD